MSFRKVAASNIALTIMPVARLREDYIVKKVLLMAIPIWIFCVAIQTAEAVGVASNQTIDKMMMDADLDEKLFIKTSGAVSGGASCSTHSVWGFVVDTSTPLGIQMYAILLSLYKDNTPVTLHGDGACSVYGTIETLNRIDLL